MEVSNFRIRGELKYRTGEAHNPVAGGHKLIVNFCDMNGTWENSFNKDIGKKYAKVEQSFKLWRQTQNGFKLGELNEVRMQSDTVILNILAIENGQLNLDALTRAFKLIAKVADDYGSSSVHIAANNILLSDENKAQVEGLITDNLLKKAIHVTIYGA